MSVSLTRILLVAIMGSMFIFKVTPVVKAQKLPLGYITQYSNKCDDETFYHDLLTEHPEYWKILKKKNLKSAWIDVPDSLSNDSLNNITKGVLSPFIFGDYILEFEFRFYNIKPSENTIFSFLGPVRSSDTYYTFNFTKDTITFYFINKGKTFAEHKLACSDIRTGWNKISVERNILRRRVTFIVNRDFSHPVSFTDPNLVMGYLGFGANCSSLLRNIIIYAATSITDTPFSWHKFDLPR